MDVKIICGSSVVNYLFANDKLQSHLTNVHINKLCYLIHGFSLAKIGRGGIINHRYGECIEAWKHGPVIPSIYHEFKRFGSDIIKEVYSTIEYEENKFVAPKIEDGDLIKVIRWVIDTIAIKNDGSIISAEELIEITHAKGSPWSEVFIENKRHIEIEDNLMSKYFIKYYNWLKEAGAKELI